MAKWGVCAQERIAAIDALAAAAAVEEAELEAQIGALQARILAQQEVSTPLPQHRSIPLPQNRSRPLPRNRSIWPGRLPLRSIASKQCVEGVTKRACA
jgi:hypothetical protein